MTLRELKVLASQGEGLRLEFKKKAAFPEKIVRELIALANTAGGYLLIGVDDDGTVSGQRYIEEEIFVMEKAISALIFPPLEYNLEKLQLNEKKGVAIFQISRSDTGPHFLWEENRKKSYVRVADRTVQASKEIWEILKKSRNQADVVFTYGQKEEVLMKLLAEWGKVTVKSYAKQAKLPRFLASRTLIRLTLANVLEIHPQESEDFFTLKETRV